MAAVRRVGKRHKKLNRSAAGTFFLIAITTFFGIFMIMPMVYSVSTALKPLDELWTFPPQFFVQNPTLKNFSDLIRLMSSSTVPFARYIFNTVFISVVGTAGNVLISSMCAYGISKLKVRGSNVMFQMVVLALMFNGTVTAIPGFLVIRAFGWINSYAAVIVPAFAAPLGLYLMKQFMEQMVPDTLLEAARIDGASEYTIFFKIVMMIVKPAWLTLIIFTFQSLWSLSSSVYIYDEQLKTFSYALSQILAGGIARAGAGAAAAVVTLLVPMIVFIISQSNVVETMATSGMKD
ncbi:MAG: carbohydrate ABC transporter permease [Oscillospiraceae bacterium]|nr:carbohydrate ABC transporter permease [Oscillospiraceae bacterium]